MITIQNLQNNIVQCLDMNLNAALKEFKSKYPECTSVRVSDSCIGHENLDEHPFEYLTFQRCEGIIDIARKQMKCNIEVSSCSSLELDIYASEMTTVRMRGCEKSSIRIVNSRVNTVGIISSNIKCVIDNTEINKGEINASSINGILRDIKIGAEIFLNTSCLSSMYINISKEAEDKVNYNHYITGFAMECPAEGSFIGYKKCKNDVIATLLVPEDAKRSSANNKKCRCSKAKVLRLEDSEGKEVKMATALYYNAIYELGKTIEASSFDENRWNECSGGIHFFMDKKMAKSYS